MTGAPSLRLLFHSATELLAAIQTGTRPADREMEHYFRTHPQLGQQDRGGIADIVYGCLRKRRSLGFRVHSDQARALVAAYLLTTGGISARRLEQDTGFGQAGTLASCIHATDLGEAPLAVRIDVPDWFIGRTGATGETTEDVIALGEALAQPAPLDMRANTLRGDREEVAARLAEEGYPATPTPYSPNGLRRPTHAPLFRTRAFQEGWFEVQDEGSQLVGLLMEPRRRECVVDFCAGAGGKTLHLGALMHNTGMLYAFDTAAFRLDRARERIRRAGLNNVRLQLLAHERDPRLARLRDKADRVLVDAPCSGSGTWRRNPDMKWRVDVAMIERLAQDQQRILGAASQLVKPGGRLVYVTCSLLAQENEEVVQHFLAEHPDFTVEPAQDILERRAVPLTMGQPFVRLTPRDHGTDGFFMAALTRAGA